MHSVIRTASPHRRDVFNSGYCPPNPIGSKLFSFTFEIIISIIISKPITKEKLPQGCLAAAQSAATPAPGALFMCTGLADDSAEFQKKNKFAPNRVRALKSMVQSHDKIA